MANNQDNDVQMTDVSNEAPTQNDAMDEDTPPPPPTPPKDPPTKEDPREIEQASVEADDAMDVDEDDSRRGRTMERSEQRRDVRTPPNKKRDVGGEQKDK